MKKKRGKINIGGNIIPENIEINFDKKNSIFLIGKEKTYSKMRFSRAELIDKLEGNSEKAGPKGMIYLQMRLKISQPQRIRKFPHANPPNPNLPIQNRKQQSKTKTKLNTKLP
jgi:hypothetical protein